MTGGIRVICIFSLVSWQTLVDAAPTPRSVPDTHYDYEDVVSPGPRSSSWMELLFLEPVYLSSSVDTDYDHDHDQVDPPYHADICGTRPGYQAGSRIVGGWVSSAVEVPWQAAIIRRQSPEEAAGDRHLDIVCGAALITAGAAVTAAHCLKLSASEYQVKLGGETSLATEECHQQVVEVTSYSIHPEYNTANLHNDIAIVRLETQFQQMVQFNKYVMPVCLPRTSDHWSLYHPGTLSLVSGFGVLRESSSVISSTLQSGILIVSHIRYLIFRLHYS